VKILIAPDKFKHALDAAGVAAAIADGVRAARPDAEIVICPLGDGGEGTGRVLAKVLGATECAADVLDPLGREHTARWWQAEADTALVEMAEASGLALLTPAERNALRTTSFGTGQVLRAALAAGCTRVLLCVGGSATVDGGAGCLQALGWKFFDHAGAVLNVPITGGMLATIGSVRPPAAPAANIEILCDVDNPLLGPRGAAAVFGPQKGASPAAVAELERGLAHWAALLARLSGADVHARPGMGAAGGVPFGLASACGAQVCRGFDEVAQRVELTNRLRGCDLCLTGEGRIDEQTAGGKVVAGVARLAAKECVPTIALVGAARLKPRQTLADLARAVGVRQIVCITPPGTPEDAALAATAENLRRAVSAVLATSL